MPNLCEQLKKDLAEIQRTYDNIVESMKDNTNITHIKELINQLKQTINILHEKVLKHLPEIIKKIFINIEEFEIKREDDKFNIIQKPGSYFDNGLIFKENYNIKILNYIKRIEGELILNIRELYDVTIPEAEYLTFEFLQKAGVLKLGDYTELEYLYVPNLEEVEYLELPNLDDIDLPNLKKAKILDLSECITIEKLNFLNSLEEVDELIIPDLIELSLPNLKKAKKLDLTASKNVSLPKLKEVEYLALYEEFDYGELPELEKAGTIDLSDCEYQWLNLDKLKEVKNLKLPYYLENIKLPNLQQAEILNWDNLNNLDHVYLPNLKTVKFLKLPETFELNLSNLQKADILDFSNLYTQTLNLPNLEEVNKLIIQNDINSISLNKLKNSNGLELQGNCTIYLKNLPLTEIKILLEKCEKQNLQNIKFIFSKEKLSTEKAMQLNQQYKNFSIQIE